MIYKQCVLTIANNTATLDEDIYLYRLDKNVELYFTIVNNKYKFDKSDMNNIITRTNASYFQMRLYKNAQVQYTFPIQPTEDGKAILTITDDLIDEPIEVGDYDFQISLLDSDKSSMISMPIVSKQLHVCEPLVDAVSESTIDTAAIDTAMVMDTDEGELPVVDSTGKYIPTVWDTKDIISKAKMNHIEQGILQSHIEALANKIPKVTPPEGNTKSDLVNFYNMLPDDGFVYITNAYYITANMMVGYLCDVETITMAANKTVKNIICYAMGITVNITSTGEIEDYGMCSADLNDLMVALTNSNREKGQVLTVIDDDHYGWGNAIPHITPPHGQTSSDIINLYNMLPDKGLVYLTEGAMIQNAGIIGLCNVYSYTSDERDLSSTDNIKSIACYHTGVCIDITSTGDVVSVELTSEDLNSLMEILGDSTRKKGQVLTMLEDTVFGWADIVPKVTPPENNTTSDLVNFYNMLPDSGSVYITEPYNLTDDVVVGYLCEVNTFEEDDEPYKMITCSTTGTNVALSSTGNLLDCALCEPHLDQLIQSLESPSRQKGQVLTVLDGNKYGWADTTPELCIHEVTGDAEVELTLDPYQLIDATPPDSSSPSITVNILLPTIDELDKHVYKIHLIFMGSSRINYKMPSGMYNCSTNDFTADMVYEFIFTYISSNWIVNGSQHKQYSNGPQ